MNDLNRLGANIRGLRIAYGETQEQLGRAINVEKSAISNYERGQREPDGDTLIAISRHFGVSIEMLLSGDFSSASTISLDISKINRNLTYIFPIFSSEKALENERFKLAVTLHKKLYDEACRLNLNLDLAWDIINTYGDVNNEEIMPEVVANELALFFLYVGNYTAGLPLFVNKSALLNHIITNNKYVRTQMEEVDPELVFALLNYGDVDPEYEIMANEIKKINEDDEVKEEITRCLIILKNSKEFADLAEYYIALQYIYNIVDNCNDIGFNQHVGMEMMEAFASVKNPYAVRFLRISRDSSQ